MSVPALEAVLELVTARIGAALAVDGPIDAAARFDEDLHADSLDLLEVIEGVEKELRSRGLQVSLPEQDFLAIRTVGDAAERIHAAVRRAAART